MNYTLIRPTTHDGWLEERQKGIGSSEAGTIMGLNHFETPYKLWLRKTGRASGTIENVAMELGHELEPYVAKKFAESLKVTIIPDSEGDFICRSNERPYLQVSPDRFFVKGDNGDYNICECKTTSQKIDPDNIPMSWYCQLQYQLFVTGYTHGAIAWLSQYRDLGYVEYDRDDEFCDTMVAKLEDFWFNHIKADVPPDPLTNEDIVLKFPSEQKDKALLADQKMFETITFLNEVKGQIAELTTQKEELENYIKATIADAEFIKDDTGRVLATYKASKGTTRLDGALLKKELPDVFKKYSKTSEGTRRLVIKEV